MDLLLLAKPGVHLYSLLHNSETAWQAIRFYDHVNLGYGVLISVSGCVAALALASDIRYYIRRYVRYHLFRTEQNKQIYATPALIDSRYLRHADSFHEGWSHRLILTITDSIEHQFICTKYEEVEERYKNKDEERSEEENEEKFLMQAQYEILCTKGEWEDGAIISNYKFIR